MLSMVRITPLSSLTPAELNVAIDVMIKVACRVARRVVFYIILNRLPNLQQIHVMHVAMTHVIAVTFALSCTCILEHWVKFALIDINTQQ